MARDCQGVTATLIDIRLGDCLDVLRTIPDGSARMCVTSPPYYGLRDYGVDGQIGLEATPDAFVAKMVEVFREVRRVLADDGTLWLNLGDSYASSGRSDRKESPGVGAKQEMKKPGRKLEWQAGGGHNFTWFIPAFGTKIKSKDLLGIPWRVAFALQADGWYLRSDIIWHKPNPMPESVRDRPTKAHEYVFLLSKRPRYYYDAEAVREPHATAATNKRYRLTPAEYEAAKAGSYHDNSCDPTQGMMQKSKPRVVMGHPSGKNARTVWTITPRPFKGAHFATFPAELAERCIKAGSSERGKCPECGAAWVRVVERELIHTQRVHNAPKYDPEGQPGNMAANRHRDGHIPGRIETTTTGWRPTCSHDLEPVPDVVLDPFAGAGTVGLVCQRLGRDHLGIELNPAYRQMAIDRIAADSPMPLLEGIA
jgi:DNA modification methylase